jgi:hypothetical protein
VCSTSVFQFRTRPFNLRLLTQRFDVKARLKHGQKIAIRPHERFALAALLLLLAPLRTRAADPFTARVVHVADGDTITVDAPGHIIRVRLAGIDCPEKNQPAQNKIPVAMVRLVRSQRCGKLTPAHAAPLSAAVEHQCHQSAVSTVVKICLQVTITGFVGLLLHCFLRNRDGISSRLSAPTSSR